MPYVFSFILNITNKLPQSHDTCWLAATEPEVLSDRRQTSDETDDMYGWVEMKLPHTKYTLQIRTVNSSTSLLDSYVGEELWDAATLFCAHLCVSSNLQADSTAPLCDVRNKRVLEIGAGCGILGMCAATLGAKDVLCTDYIKPVLENLAFNLQHNQCSIFGGNNPKGIEESSCLTSAPLDWRQFALEDVQATEWANRQWNTDVCDHSNGKASQFEPDVVVGSALVYSAEGALFCADTIYHFIFNKGSREAWVLQMPERPGFHLFLRRLEDLGMTYKCYDISKHIYDIACNEMGTIKSPRESFALYIIT